VDAPVRADHRSYRRIVFGVANALSSIGPLSVTSSTV
jgi:hypothetical protein